MGGHVATNARRRHHLSRAFLGILQVTGRTRSARVFALQRKAELTVVDFRPLEPGVLVMTFLAILRPVANRVVRHVTIETAARHGTLPHLRVLVTLDAGLVGVLSLERQLGVLGVLRLPGPQPLPAQ